MASPLCQKIITYSSWSTRFTDYWSLTDLVDGIGLEPTTSSMSTMCSNQLSYPSEGLALYRGCAYFAIWSFLRNPRDYQRHIIYERLSIRMLAQRLEDFLNDLFSR